MADMQKTPFVRELASSDRRTRDKALESLTLFLRSRTDLSLIDLLKLWKGLFFCIYHSDRPLTQQALARALSYSLVPTLPRSSLHRFLRAFWITIGKDFHAIDRLRLDKYLYLIRCYVGVAFEVFLKPRLKTDSGPGQKGTSGKKRKRGESDNTSANGKKQKKKLKKSEVGPQDGSNETGQQNGQGEEDEEEEELDEKWAELSAYLSILEEGPLCPVNFDPDQNPSSGVSTNKKKSKNGGGGGENDSSDSTFVSMPHGPDGLRYHVMDIWLDELEKVLEFEEDEEEEDDEKGENGDGGEEGEGEDGHKKGGVRIRRPKGDVPFSLLLRPMENLRKESPHKPVRMRAADVLNDERLVEWGFKEKPAQDGDDDDGDEVEWGGFD